MRLKWLNVKAFKNFGNAPKQRRPVIIRGFIGKSNHQSAFEMCLKRKIFTFSSHVYCK